MPVTTEETATWKKWVLWLAAVASELAAYRFLGDALHWDRPARFLLGLTAAVVVFWVVARLLDVKLKLWGWE